MWTVIYTFLAALLQSISGAAPASGPYAGELANMWFGLYIAPTAAGTPNSVMANITEADYTGYARQEVVWYPTYQDPSGTQNLDGASMFFQPLDGAVPNVITGMFLATAETGGLLLAMQGIPEPGYILASPIDGLPVWPTIRFDPNGNWGGAYILP